MRNIFGKTRSFMLTQQSNIIASTILIASALLLARLFGFLRFRVLNSYFTTSQLDVYYGAFRIPDFVFELLITGALTTTFIPFYLAYQNDKGKQSAVMSAIINVILVCMLIAIGVLVIIMPYLMPLIAPGFPPEKQAEIVLFSRIILVGQLPFLIGGNFLTGISQANKRFLLPALAPLAYNIGIIVATMVFAQSLGIYAPLVGVIVGAVLFFGIQIPVIRSVDFHYQMVIGYLDECTRFVRIAIPRLITVLVAQIDATVDLTLATTLGAGTYTVFYLSQHLQLLPVSIIGMAFGQASLPYLSEMYQNGKKKEFKKLIIDSLINLVFFTVPFMVFFTIARTPIVRMFYGGSMFDWEATVTTAQTMSYFALSIPFHCSYYFLTRCFYASFDTRTPLYISLISITLNAVLSIFAIYYLHLPVMALGLTFSITMIFNVILLILFLNRKLDGIDLRSLLIETVKVMLAGAIAGAMVFSAQRLLDGLIFDTARTLYLGVLLFVDFVLLVVVYLFAAWALSSRGLFILTNVIPMIKKYQRKMTEQFTGIEG